MSLVNECQKCGDYGVVEIGKVSGMVVMRSCECEMGKLFEWDVTVYNGKMLKKDSYFRVIRRVPEF